MDREQRRQWRRYVFGCTDLTQAQRLVLLALESFADFPEGTNARPGRAALAQMCGLGTRVVDTALDRGRRLGLIGQTARANPKLGRAATYRLLSTRTSVQAEPISTCVGVQLETDFNSHETDFNSHVGDISTRTSVRPTNSDDQCSNTKGLGARARGTYLPDDWSPAPEVVAQMRAEQPHVDQDAELKKFCDYWHAAIRNAKKRDWTAAYRLWVRRAAEQASLNGSPGMTAFERKKAHNASVFQALAGSASDRPELTP